MVCAMLAVVVSVVVVVAAKKDTPLVRRKGTTVPLLEGQEAEESL